MRKATQEIIKNTFSYAIRLVQQIRRNSSLSWTRFYFLYIQCAFLPSSSSMLHFGALFWALSDRFFLCLFSCVFFFSLELRILDFCLYTYLLSQSGFLPVKQFVFLYSDWAQSKQKQNLSLYCMCIRLGWIQCKDGISAIFRITNCFSNVISRLFSN